MLVSAGAATRFRGLVVGFVERQVFSVVTNRPRRGIRAISHGVEETIADGCGSYHQKNLAQWR